MVMSPSEVASLYKRNAGPTLITAQGAAQVPGVSVDPSSSKFMESVVGVVREAVANNQKAERVAVDALVGQASLTDLATSISVAESSLQTVVAVRDRIISAYQEIMRMPI